MCRRKAVLIIHGLAGGTYDEEYVARYLQLEKKFDVYTFTLPGHEVKDRRLATCKEWIKASENQLKYLTRHGYKEIYILGHSMGGVIATHLAKENKCVKRLVLVAPAFTSIASKEEGGVFKALFKIPELIKAYSINELITRLNKLPLSAEKEFIKLIETYKDDIKSITIPTMFVHGTEDQMVPIKSSINLYNELNTKKKELLVIKEYYHDVFKGKKVDKICHEIRVFLKKRKFRIKETKLEI